MTSLRHVHDALSGSSSGATAEAGFRAGQLDTDSACRCAGVCFQRLQRGLSVPDSRHAPSESHNMDQHLDLKAKRLSMSSPNVKEELGK
jgi:hypothetical protein